MIYTQNNTTLKICAAIFETSAVSNPSSRPVATKRSDFGFMLEKDSPPRESKRSAADAEPMLVTAGFTVCPGSYTHWSSFIGTTPLSPTLPPPTYQTLPAPPATATQACTRTRLPRLNKLFCSFRHLHNEASVSGNKTNTHTHTKLSQISVLHLKERFSTKKRPSTHSVKRHKLLLHSSFLIYHIKTSEQLLSTLKVQS